MLAALQWLRAFRFPPRRLKLFRDHIKYLGHEVLRPCDRLYVPHALRHWVIEAAHQFLGHAGIISTAHFCQKRVFMFWLIPEIYRVLQLCHACQVKSQAAPTQKDVPRPSVQAGAPFQVWNMDVVGRQF